MAFRKTFLPIFIVVLALLSTSCTTTDAFTSLGDNFYNVADDQQLLIVTTNLLENRLSQKMEYVFIEALADYGMVGYSWIDAFPPVKEYDKNEYGQGITD